jgi:hypothetical protein
MTNTATNKIIKSKKLKTCSVILESSSVGNFVLSCFDENKKLIKAKVFVSSPNKSIDRLVRLTACREFRVWINTYYKFGYLENDDSQILDKFN